MCIRDSQKIEDERFLYWCDVKGMLVWSEMAAAYEYSDYAVEEFTREWLEIVHQNYNHPCIITWTPFNESWGCLLYTSVSWFTPPYTISNYSDIIKNSSVPLWFMNSLFIAVIVTVATVLVTGMAAYALALIPFKGSQLFLIYVLIGMMVPGEATICLLYTSPLGSELLIFTLFFFFPVLLLPDTYIAAAGLQFSDTPFQKNR